MKYFRLLPLLCCFSVIAQAQEKFFDEAIRRGRKADEFYQALHSGKQIIPVEKVITYANKKEYIIRNYETAYITRFGDKVESIYSCLFLPQNELPAYIFSKHLCEKENFDFKELISKGSIYFFHPKKEIFIKIDNALWSGSVENNLIQSKNGEKGIGYKQLDDNTYVYFEGVFKDGHVYGDGYFKLYTKSDKINEIDQGKTINYKINIGRFSEEMAPIRIKNEYGFINNHGEIVIEPVFKDIVRGFQQGFAIVKQNDGTEVVVDRKGVFVDYSEEQKKRYAEDKAIEEKRLAEQRRLEEERQKIRIEIDKQRINRLKQATVGDRICYIQDWSTTYDDREYFLGFHLWGSETKVHYSMKVICFIEKIVGDKVQIRVGNVASSNKKEYATPIIDGISYYKGDLLWIKPLKEGSNWFIED
ncbi:WG repeat-containing protein [Tannerella forsythia]|uniref:WG repeat-containing protein n=1 Tax=Tannerella forsythia TaxID=28112 RepID=A0A3P1XM68_TANFO|nr:WG repeat-containing protein [Tannerella forsythia]RRD59884.1 hypothetical protein EII40_08705 [Tannerella forsythia]